VGSAGHVLHCGASKAQNVDAPFFMLGWVRCSSIKSMLGHVTPHLCFLHLVGSAGHVVHSGASGARNIDTLFFILAWERYVFNKKCAGTRYAELVFFASGVIYGTQSAFQCVQGTKHRHTIFHARDGPVWIRQKVCWDTLCQSCVFASTGIYGSCSAFRRIRSMKR
jgi:hypothetical protein